MSTSVVDKVSSVGRSVETASGGGELPSFKVSVATTSLFLDEASKVRVSLTNVVADTSTETSVITSCLVDVASVCESVVIALIFMVVSLDGDSVVPATLGDGVPSVEISIELGSVVIGIT